MSLSIRSFICLAVAAIALVCFAAPVHARPSDPAVKIEKIVVKTVAKLTKTVESYDKKLDSLVARTTAKVARMVAKGKPAEDINAVVAKAIVTGMNGYAPLTRTKIEATVNTGMRSLAKYSEAPTAEEGEIEIAEAADICFEDINEIWGAAGTMLHALEVAEE